MKRSFRKTVSSVVLIISCLALTTATVCAASSSLIAGVWNMVQPSTDASGSPCPFVPQTFDFRKDGTVMMSNMPPGMTARYRTGISEDEAKAVNSRTGLNWSRKEIMLMLMGPGDDWAGAGMPYRYRIKGDTLSLEVPGWTPAKFKKAKAAKQ